MKFLYSLMNWFRRLGVLHHEGLFEWTPEDFTKARRWAKNQDHPHFPGHPRLSLWDHVNSNFIDSEYKLHEINKRKALTLSKKGKKKGFFKITKEDIYGDLFK